MANLEKEGREKFIVFWKKRSTIYLKTITIFDDQTGNLQRKIKIKEGIWFLTSVIQLSILLIIERGGDLINNEVERICKVCGIGRYKSHVDSDSSGSEREDFGLHLISGKFKAFTCNHCGHVQLFHFDKKEAPPAWAQDNP